MANTFHEFTHLDWMGLAGAERFEDGSEPLLCDKEIEAPNGVWMIGLDKNGIWVDFYSSGEGDFEMKSFSLRRGDLTKESMKRLASTINPLVDNLEELGFDQIA